MKKLIYSFAVPLLLGALAHADEQQLACRGTGEYRGSTAEATLSQDGELEFSGTLVMKDWNSKINCTAHFDKTYKPRTPKPKYDRYRTNGKFCGDYAFISKSLPAEGTGYINYITESCGHPGDTCETGFYCEVK